MTPLLLTLDPSLRCTGALLVTLDGEADLVAAEAVHTYRGTDSGDALVQQHDAGRRAVALYEALVTFIAAHPGIAVVALETPLGAQDAAAAWAMARAHTAARCALAATLPGLRPIAVSQYEAKLHATGTKVPKDAKGDVMRGVLRRFGPSAWAHVLEHILDRDEREAVYDAGAVAMVALRHPAARLVTEDHRRAQGAPEEARGIA